VAALRAVGGVVVHFRCKKSPKSCDLELGAVLICFFISFDGLIMMDTDFLHFSEKNKHKNSNKTGQLLISNFVRKLKGKLNSIRLLNGRLIGKKGVSRRFA
jgi:hypothetical protein